MLAGTIGLVIVWELTEASFGIQTAGDSPIIRKKSNMDGAGGGILPMISWLKGCDTILGAIARDKVVGAVASANCT